jgi:radical SAM superfamily enzyme YgiQ (UPF0313 family)
VDAVNGNEVQPTPSSVVESILRDSASAGEGAGGSGSRIILTTLNARFAHSALGLRYLKANLRHLKDHAQILEFDLQRQPLDIVEEILSHHPKIVAFSVYVWNVAPLTDVVKILKRLAPSVFIILGGPEISHEFEDREIAGLADYIIPGEGEITFFILCQRILASFPPPEKVCPGPLPDLNTLSLPYALYSDADIAHRMIYVEASRGCPFKCEFCLSSLDELVRYFPIERFLDEMQRLMDRGASLFKFVDRTFNVNLNVGLKILDFFYERKRPGMFLHFEMIPDRLPSALLESLARFEPGMIQLEIGIQTFNPLAAKLISRKQDNDLACANIRLLREKTGVYLHTDLVAGLPGEDLSSFAGGFDRLLSLNPQEIQLGILKRLPGAPIARHDADWQMVYSPVPPYEILQNKLMDFATLRSLKRMARYWDLVVNSGRFPNSSQLLWKNQSPFHAFMCFSNWLHEKAGKRTHGIALPDLARIVFSYLKENQGISEQEAMAALGADFAKSDDKSMPDFLKTSPGKSGKIAKLNQRQLRRE